MYKEVTPQSLHHIRTFCKDLENRASTNLEFHGIAMLARNTCDNKLVQEIGHTVAHQERDRGETHSLMREIFNGMIIKRAYPRRNRSFLKIPVELYAHGLQQLKLIESQERDDGVFVRETIAFLKYAYYEDGDHYRLVDKSEQEALDHIAYFFNEILLANRLALETITLEQIGNEFLAWLQSYVSHQISEHAALRLALHIAVSLHETKITRTKHREVTLVLTENEDRFKKCTLGINALLLSSPRLPLIESNGKISCTRNTIPLITSQIASAHAQCDLRTSSVLAIDRENYIITTQDQYL